MEPAGTVSEKKVLVLSSKQAGAVIAAASGDGVLEELLVLACARDGFTTAANKQVEDAYAMLDQR